MNLKEWAKKLKSDIPALIALTIKLIFDSDCSHLDSDYSADLQGCFLKE